MPDLLSDPNNVGFTQKLNWFVEAGAGTGKTTALVTRIVELIAAGALQMERLAAITFTEAAAAELRDRIRQDLEHALDRLAAYDPSGTE